ncbi:hypothetical protein JYU34_005263 [Plutella xylostella]|uniref:Uncharacterized protein n=2 Tax=Plutella xylostella TaxID=51655 RepID=A0ABQ7QW87_PLUXY|nr:uncharacterized protein LOC125488758 [Plutella xylostella]KAG7309318.1 hypothetical protein JYU34_005263 [Plutella xylostella]CAG9112943.1 unnamed protein product [Plutella xylostella]
MVQYTLFLDRLRQEEIDKFYEACQMHRDFYRGLPQAHHPLDFFREPAYAFQCPPEMSHVYLGYPAYHVKYKAPPTLPPPVGRVPDLPQRSLAGRFDKKPCQVFMR